MATPAIHAPRWAAPLAIAAATLVVAADVALAAWTAGALGAESSRAKTLGTGNVPDVVGEKIKGKTTVTVTWSPSTFVEGGPVPAYIVRRYNAVTLVGQGAAGGCSGLVVGTTCAEANVQNGSWRYSVTPAAATWRGVESAKSAVVAG